MEEARKNLKGNDKENEIDENSENIDIFEKKAPEPKIDKNSKVNLKRKTMERKSSTDDMVKTIGSVTTKNDKRKSGFGKPKLNIGVDDNGENV
jgi:hypothetical protein